MLEASLHRDGEEALGDLVGPTDDLALIHLPNLGLDHEWCREQPPARLPEHLGQCAVIELADHPRRDPALLEPAIEITTQGGPTRRQ